MRVSLALGLTLARLGAPLVICPLIFLPNPLATGLAALIFTLAAVSDGLDGWIARRTATTSRWGQILDPVADKVLVLLTLLALAAADRLGVWALIASFALFFRELITSALRQALADVGAGLPTTGLSKTKTFFTYLGCGLLILGGSSAGWGALSLGLAVLLGWTATLLALRDLAEG